MYERLVQNYRCDMPPLKIPDKRLQRPLHFWPLANKQELPQIFFLVGVFIPTYMCTLHTNATCRDTYVHVYVCIMFAVIMLFVRAKRYGPKIPLATISYLILFVKIHHGCVCVFDWMVTWVISSGSLHVHKAGYSHMEVWRQIIRVQRSANSICG